MPQIVLKDEEIMKIVARYLEKERGIKIIKGKFLSENILVKPTVYEKGWRGFLGFEKEKAEFKTEFTLALTYQSVLKPKSG